MATIPYYVFVLRKIQSSDHCSRCITGLLTGFSLSVRSLYKICNDSTY
jgi:hypothetical protein